MRVREANQYRILRLVVEPSWGPSATVSEKRVVSRREGDVWDGEGRVRWWAYGFGEAHVGKVFHFRSGVFGEDILRGESPWRQAALMMAWMRGRDVPGTFDWRY